MPGDAADAAGGPVDIERIRAELLRDREAVATMARDLGASFEDIVAAARDSNLDDEHDPEGGTIAAERSLVASMAATARGRLAEIDRALARIADGSYGRCAHCGRPIAPGRLEARPTATLCIRCAR